MPGCFSCNCLWSDEDLRGSIILDVYRDRVVDLSHAAAFGNKTRLRSRASNEPMLTMWEESPTTIVVESLMC